MTKDTKAPTKFERISPLTGKRNVMVLEVKTAELLRYALGGKIQECFPDLTPDEREFILTGYTKEDWDTISSTEED